MHKTDELFRLDGKVAIVTGGAKGLGASMAEVFAWAGARVVVTDLLEKEGSEVADRICAGGGDAIFVRHDVTDEAQWENAVGKTLARFGRLDVLLNNAGIEVPALISQCTVESFRRTMDINVTGVFLGLKHAIKAMSPDGAAGRGGSIVNLSSAAGMIGVVAHSAYCTSKGAVRLLTKSAAVECARLGLGIRVNSLHPGIIETDMGSNFIRGFVDLGLAPNLDAANASILALHPMGHYGKPIDVSAAALFLASDASRWITGAELAVDGGVAAS